VCKEGLLLKRGLLRGVVLGQVPSETSDAEADGMEGTGSSTSDVEEDEEVFYDAAADMRAVKASPVPTPKGSVLYEPRSLPAKQLSEGLRKAPTMG
jgi:hypothetical protein